MGGSSPLHISEELALICSGATIAQQIASLRGSFSSIFPELHQGSVDLRVTLAQILHRILSSPEVVTEDSSEKTALDDLRIKFMEESLDLDKLQSTSEIEHILVQNQCDDLLQKILDTRNGSLSLVGISMISLFELLGEGLSGSHPESQTIQDWFFSVWFRLGISFSIDRSLVTNTEYRSEGLLRDGVLAHEFQIEKSMSQVDFARGIIVALCQYTLHVLMSQIGVNAGMNHDDSLVLEELFSGIGAMINIISVDTIRANPTLYNLIINPYFFTLYRKH